MEYFNIDELYEDRVCYGGQNEHPEDFLLPDEYEDDEEDLE